ncbi:Hsp33 family molecular chaperone HslO [Dasania marina]|uniref:Hsp33 family molecular chaperone HslO n=1 Tax=Dasania marina TaxID=471499 RepID=UPI000368A2CA|nr:Hsp33 family molecular chaperone HslO [Dasania marina]
MPDHIQRFIFDDADIRGELVQLEQSYQTTLSKHHYPAPVARLLGDFLSAAALLSQTIKFDGCLILQARSEGEVPLIMAEATSQGHVRGIAKEADAAVSEDFQTLLKNGQLSITIDPAKGQRYQGIVPLDGRNLAACLEHYFAQSEQLSTHIILAADGSKSAGMLLQELPVSAAHGAQDRSQQWQHVTQLANTLKPQELLNLDFNTLLHRLYHQEQVRVFDPSTLKFQCSCSEQRTEKAIYALGRSESEALIAEAGEIAIRCEFCHHDYRFGSKDLSRIFKTPLH